MLLKSLLGEFEHEVTNTRKLLEAVPADKTGFKVTDFGWTLGQLAQHIATIYFWYVGTLTLDVYDIGATGYEQPDPMDIAATKDLFERNVEKARAALKSISEHHRGELVVYLRAAGAKVPGLYGPTYEETAAFLKIGEEKK
ncbi:MAG: damage-inducible protein DinB [Chitinophagaceae bacterium]|nr:MAG: damage-inducible protein DinB [Chitinophagaceae bacterium]